MWRLLRVWSVQCCTLNIWTVLWVVHCIFAQYCAHTLHTHSHTQVFSEEVCDLGLTSCRKIKKLKFSALTHECRASWSNVCLISSPWLYIIRCIRQKASWWLIHRAAGRIRESASEKELRSHFFQRGAFKALLGFLGSECKPLTSTVWWSDPIYWKNMNEQKWQELSIAPPPRSFWVFFGSPCGFRYLGT